MANAPVCNVSISPQPGNPQSPKSIAPNATLPQVIQILNNVLFKGNFVEDKSKRQTTTVRIFDPDDHSIYVDVQQITALTLVNNQTGQTIHWRQ